MYNESASPFIPAGTLPDYYLPRAGVLVATEGAPREENLLPTTLSVWKFRTWGFNNLLWARSRTSLSALTLVPPRPASLWRIFSHLVQFHLRRAHCHLSLFTQCSEIISPCAGIRPGKVDCFLQHTLKIGSQSHQYVFALADWYVEDENRTNMASPLKFGEKHFFLEAHHGIFQWPEFFPNLLLHLHLKTKLS